MGILISTMFGNEGKDSRIIKGFSKWLVQKWMNYLSGSNAINLITALVILENIAKWLQVAKMPDCSQSIKSLLDLVCPLS